jgi:hypothetical protein
MHDLCVCVSGCKYDKKGAEWSACDPALHVKTKTVLLLKGKDGCPEMRTLTRPCKAGVEINGKRRLCTCALLEVKL